MTETKKKAPASTKTTTAKPKAAPVKKVATRKPAAKKAAASSSNEAHYNRIQEAAYLIAERNNFSGDPISYWLEAEALISGK